MRILIEGKSYKDYLAKCHEAFRTGLRALFDARSFGDGYPDYSPSVKTYAQIIQRTFSDVSPDIIIGDSYYPDDLEGFNYAGMADLSPLRSFILGDYWFIAEKYHEGFVAFAQKNKIDFILSYFPQPLKIWSASPIGRRMAYLPPCFDPRIFNNWQVEKTHDVGFLAAGTTEYNPCYPERFSIHQKLLERKDLKYLWAFHPGWKSHIDVPPLVGVGFSKAINSCRLFITTSGIYKNPHAKYVEIMASHTVLLADEPEAAGRLHLQDGVNYIRVSESDILEKIDWCLARPEICQKIAEAGYRTAMRHHTCYTRAWEFYEATMATLK